MTDYFPDLEPRLHFPGIEDSIITPSTFDDPTKPSTARPGQVTSRNFGFILERQRKNEEKQRVRDKKTITDLESVGRRADGISAEDFDEFAEFQEVVNRGYPALYNLFKQLENENVNGWVYFHAIAKIMHNHGMPPIDLPEDSQDSHEALRDAYLQYAYEHHLLTKPGR